MTDRPSPHPTRAYRLLRFALQRVGKDYTPDPRLPAGLIAGVLRTRALWLGRGVLRFRRRVFVDSAVRVRGKRFVELGEGSTLERGVVLDGYSRDGVHIGPRTRIGAYSVISCTSHLSLLGKGFTIGADCGMGDFCCIGAAGGVVIGDNVIMGQLVTFHSQEHEFDDPDRPIREQGTHERGIVIEDDCWIGARVTFLDGSRVGRGSVVAAGAVVRGEFPPMSVIAGVPARRLRSRGAIEAPAGSA